MPLNKAERRQDLEDENGRLKRLMADLNVDCDALKWLTNKTGPRDRLSISGKSLSRTRQAKPDSTGHAIEFAWRRFENGSSQSFNGLIDDEIPGLTQS